MLSATELKEFRLRRGLSTRDVEQYCNVTHQLIADIENEKKAVTEYNHKEITSGINRAFFAKINGTFSRDGNKKDKENTTVEKDKNTAKKNVAKQGKRSK